MELCGSWTDRWHCLRRECTVDRESTQSDAERCLKCIPKLSQPKYFWCSRAKIDRLLKLYETYFVVTCHGFHEEGAHSVGGDEKMSQIEIVSEEDEPVVFPFNQVVVLYQRVLDKTIFPWSIHKICREEHDQFVGSLNWNSLKDTQNYLNETDGEEGTREKRGGSGSFRLDNCVEKERVSDWGEETVDDPETFPRRDRVPWHR